MQPKSTADLKFQFHFSSYQKNISFHYFIAEILLEL